MRLKANIGAVEILVHGLIWLLLSVVTFGIAAFFLPYSFCKFIINRTELIDEYGETRRLHCDLNVLDQFGHALLWLLFSVLTMGIAYFFTCTRCGITR